MRIALALLLIAGGGVLGYLTLTGKVGGAAAAASSTSTSTTTGGTTPPNAVGSHIQ